MKTGDLVTFTNSKGGKTTGMIVYKKDNNNIGVNFAHYAVMSDWVKKGQMTLSDMMKALKAIGSDKVFCKDQLKPYQP